MRPGFRLLAAVLALLTLSLTIAEGVWASSCRLGMPPVGAMAEDGPGASGMTHAMAAAAGAHPAHDLRGAGVPDGSGCPLAPGSGPCVALSFSLPAPVPPSLVPSPEGTLRVVAPAHAPERLFASSFFRPPRA